MNTSKVWVLKLNSQPQRFFVLKTQIVNRRKRKVAQSGTQKYPNCNLSTKNSEINLKLKKPKITSTWMLLRFSLHNWSLQRIRSLSLKNKFRMLTTFSNGVKDQMVKRLKLRVWKVRQGFTSVKSQAVPVFQKVEEPDTPMQLECSPSHISKMELPHSKKGLKVKSTILWSFPPVHTRLKWRNIFHL